MNHTHVCVAAITGSFGVRGEARVKSFCAEPSAFADYGPLSNEAGNQEFQITIIRAVKGGFAVRLGGVKTKEQADALRGTRLYAPRAALPTLPDDEYYYSDLIGLPVADTAGNIIGKVQAVQDYGAGDILEIAPKGGGASILLPFTRAVVPTVDLTRQRIVVDPPEEIIAKAPNDG